jgi:Cu-Zn family superoxide dismutase
MRVLLSLVAACALASPAAAQQSQAGTDVSRTVEIKNAEGQPVGTVQVRQLAHGTLFIVDLSNLPPGPHGFHIHERGVCEPPSFQSAGGHYNPLNAEHGFDSPKGFHAGDLPNVHVTKQGTAMAEFHSTRVSLADREGAEAAGSTGPSTLLDQDGSAIMIHEKGDDYRPTTPDSSGDRIACGVIKAP